MITEPIKEICKKDIQRLQYDKMIRMRWRLWFAFSESRYEQFRYKETYGKPNYATIKEYCIEHWGKEPADMTLTELRKYISIVTKWKLNGKNSR